MIKRKKDKPGRKPIPEEEKKVLVGFYIQQKFVDRAGGLSEARRIAAHELQKYTERIELA